MSVEQLYSILHAASHRSSWMSGQASGKDRAFECHAHPSDKMCRDGLLWLRFDLGWLAAAAAVQPARPHSHMPKQIRQARMTLLIALFFCHARWILRVLPAERIDPAEDQSLLELVGSCLQAHGSLVDQATSPPSPAWNPQVEIVQHDFALWAFRA